MLSRSRIEYLGYGCNWRSGCTHVCDYCYAAATLINYGKHEGPWGESQRRHEVPADVLRAYLSDRKSALPQRPIMVCTSHDPFAPGMDHEREGRAVLEALGDFGLLRQTLVLTKSPQTALTHVAHLGRTGLRFGTSLTSLDDAVRQQHELAAEPVQARLDTLPTAARLGFAIWVSIEPPLAGQTITGLVEAVIGLDLPLRPWLVVGRLNVRGKLPANLAEWAREHDWAGDRDRAVTLLEQAGYELSVTPGDGRFWIKGELARS